MLVSDAVREGVLVCDAVSVHVPVSLAVEVGELVWELVCVRVEDGVPVWLELGVRV